MKLLKVFIFACSVLYSPVLFAADRPKDEALAVAYIEALTTGDSAKATSLCAAPFFFDRKKILSTMAEVTAAHEEIAKQQQKKVRQNLKFDHYTIVKTDKATKLDNVNFPEYVVFQVSFDQGSRTENARVYISVGEAPKVLGYDD